MPSFPMHFLISILLAPRGPTPPTAFSSSLYSHLFIVPHKSPMSPQASTTFHIFPHRFPPPPIYGPNCPRGDCVLLISFLPFFHPPHRFPNPILPPFCFHFRDSLKKRIFYSIHKNMAKPHSSSSNFSINSSSRIFVIFLLFFLLFSSSPTHSRAFHPPSGLTFVRSNGRYWPLMFVYANSLDSSTDSASSGTDQLESKSIGELLEEQQPLAAPSKRAIMRLGKRAMMRLGRK